MIYSSSSVYFRGISLDFCHVFIFKSYCYEHSYKLSFTKNNVFIYLDLLMIFVLKKIKNDNLTIALKRMLNLSLVIK